MQMTDPFSGEIYFTVKGVCVFFVSGRRGRTIHRSQPHRAGKLRSAEIQNKMNGDRLNAKRRRLFLYNKRIKPIADECICINRADILSSLLQAAGFLFWIFTGAEVSDKNPEKQIKNRGRKKE